MGAPIPEMLTIKRLCDSVGEFRYGDGLGRFLLWHEAHKPAKLRVTVPLKSGVRGFAKLEFLLAQPNNQLLDEWARCREATCKLCERMKHPTQCKCETCREAKGEIEYLEGDDPANLSPESQRHFIDEPD
jgi:hypothetical protein